MFNIYTPTAPRGGRGRGGSSSTSFRGGSSTRGTNPFHQQQQTNTSFNNNQHQQSSSGTVTYDFNNLPNDVQYNELQKCVTDNTPHGFRYVKLTLHGNRAQLIVNQHDNNKIQSLINGQANIRGTPIQLSISTQQQTHSGQSTGGGKPLNQSQKDQLKQLIQSRYDHNAMTLNLSSTYSPDFDYNNKMFINELCNNIQHITPNVVTIDLSNNGIQQCTYLHKLGYIASSLKNLSLANNNINNIEQIEGMSTSGLKDHIQNLILQNNPVINIIQQTYNDNTYTTYHKLIECIFHNIRTLDGQSIQHTITFDVPDMNNNLPPIQTSYFDNDKSQQLVISFVTKYFNIYDTSQQHRQSLLSVYAENSQFTVCVGDNIAGNIPNEYTQRSHNIYNKQTTQQQSQQQPSISLGQVAIAYTLSTLPHTQHDISNFTADVYSVNSLGGSIVLTLKGQYLENNTDIRQFHRVFILVSPTSEAQNKQWNVSILNDMLYIGTAKPFVNPQLQQQQQVIQQPTVQQPQQSEAFFTM